MKIGLYDCDHKQGGFPNIALMKISAYHKGQGDLVEWWTPFEEYEAVYVSKVMTASDNPPAITNANHVIKGGTGFAIKKVDGKEKYLNYRDRPLPDEIEHIYPDYSIYGIEETAYGFLTRGCPRHCPFCHVGDKEGLVSRKVANLSEFWNGQKNIVLCDPNFLACRNWRELAQQLIESKAYVDFNQGLDIRMMTDEKAKVLSKIKMREVHFAWDRYEDGHIVIPKLELFAKYSKMPGRHNAIVFTLVNFDTTIEQDLERIYTLRKIGYWAYVMIYDKEHCDGIYKKLQRWVNNRFVFAKCDNFDDYLRNAY